MISLFCQHWLVSSWWVPIFETFFAREQLEKEQTLIKCQKRNELRESNSLAYYLASWVLFVLVISTCKPYQQRSFFWVKHDTDFTFIHVFFYKKFWKVFGLVWNNLPFLNQTSPNQHLNTHLRPRSRTVKICIKKSFISSGDKSSTHRVQRESFRRLLFFGGGESENFLHKPT